jgi:hypothetical protein
MIISKFIVDMIQLKIVSKLSVYHSVQNYYSSKIILNLSFNPKLLVYYSVQNLQWFWLWFRFKSKIVDLLHYSVLQ